MPRGLPTSIKMQKIVKFNTGRVSVGVGVGLLQVFDGSVDHGAQDCSSKIVRRRRLSARMVSFSTVWRKSVTFCVVGRVLLVVMVSSNVRGKRVARLYYMPRRPCKRTPNSQLSAL